MVVADSHGLPVGLCIESASPHEVKLVDSTLVAMVIPEAPQNLVGDNAYDSDILDAELHQFGIELIARHRSNRKNKSQDGRRLRRCRRRWKNRHWKARGAGIARAGRALRCILEHRATHGHDAL
jgi:Transposase DDE domain